MVCFLTLQGLCLMVSSQTMKESCHTNNTDVGLNSLLFKWYLWYYGKHFADVSFHVCSNVEKFKVPQCASPKLEKHSHTSEFEVAIMILLSFMPLRTLAIIWHMLPKWGEVVKNSLGVNP